MRAPCLSLVTNARVTLSEATMRCESCDSTFVVRCGRLVRGAEAMWRSQLIDIFGTPEYTTHADRSPVAFRNVVQVRNLATPPRLLLKPQLPL